MKTIQLSDESYNFLMNLSKELNTQDNRGTAMPYFFQVKTKHRVLAPQNSGIEAWYCDGDIIETEEEIREAIEAYKDWDDITSEYEKLNEDDKIKTLKLIGYNKIYYDYDDRYENAFLTSKACDEHIKLNKHNLSQPVNYLSYANRNPELEKLMGIICGLTGGNLHK